jgi:O-antigen/teichoic acid export membrane protein
MTINEYIHKLKENSLFRDSSWSVFGNALGYGFFLIAGVVIARFLGKDIYGEYGMIKAMFLNVAIFSTFGLGYTATKFIAESKDKDNQYIRQIVLGSINVTFVISILLASLLFAFSKQIASYLNAEHLSISLRIFAVSIVFNAIATVQIGILAGFKAFKSIAINNAVVGAVAFVLSIVLTYYWNIEGALSALLVATLFKCVLNTIVVRKKLRRYRNFRSNHQMNGVVRQLLLFSLPITLHEGVYAITSWLSILLLVKLTNYGEVGLYSVATQWVAIILFIPGVLRNVALSHLSGVNDNIVQHKTIFNRIVMVNFVTTLIPCLIVVIFSGLISSFYGESFTRLPLILNIAVLSAVFMGIQNVYIQNYLSINKIWVHFYLSTLFNILTLILAFLLIRRNPEKGAELSALVLLIISTIKMLSYHFVLRYINRKRE